MLKVIAILGVLHAGESLDLTEPFSLLDPENELEVCAKDYDAAQKIKLTSMIYTSKNSWCIWLNDKMYQNAEECGNLEIVSVSKNSVELQVPGHGKVQLKVGQVLNLKNGQVQ